MPSWPRSATTSPRARWPSTAHQASTDIEASIAAQGGSLVVASISLHHDGPETLSDSSLFRGVGVVVSHDDGESFGQAFNPGFTDAETSDPVVRVTPNGTFWLAAVGINPNLVRAVLLASRNGGHTGLDVRGISSTRCRDGRTARRCARSTKESYSLCQAPAPIPAARRADNAAFGTSS